MNQSPFSVIKKDLNSKIQLITKNITEINNKLNIVNDNTQVNGKILALDINRQFNQLLSQFNSFPFSKADFPQSLGRYKIKFLPFKVDTMIIQSVG